MSSRALRKTIPYLLILPGLAWLSVFYLVPIAGQFKTSLESGTLLTGIAFTWQWSNYWDAVTVYGPIFARSFGYAASATVLAIAVGYPLAYFIVFRGGRFKLFLLFPVIVPFLITYMIRTVSWQALLSDDGIALSFLRYLHLISTNTHMLGSPLAVIFALAYNFLPFAILPVYVSLDKIERSVLLAANDLYAHPPTVFRKVVFPLSLPGVFAGSLLTFIPAAGDYVNAMMLGGPRQQMIGNVIRSHYLVVLNYPLAAAASIVLMISLLICVTMYSRIFGTEELTG